MKNINEKTQPNESPISPEIIAKWRSMVMQDNEKDRESAENYFFENILPHILEIVGKNPQHMELRNEGFHTLISLMGFSPETTVISTFILQPKQLVIVYSSNSGKYYNRAFEFLLKKEILNPDQIKQIKVEPTKHYDIYDDIRHCILQQRNTETDMPLKHIMDITGGKKVMSASAAQAAWELNLPLCYIENEKYDKSLRRPIPGFEILQKLPDPGKEKGAQRRVIALDVYKNRNYNAALDYFKESRKFNRGDHLLEDFGEIICACYSAWTDLNLPELDDKLKKMKGFVTEDAMLKLFERRSYDQIRLQRHLDALTAVAKNETLALMATFFELAKLYSYQKRHDFSCLLTYRCMEAMVEFALTQANGGKFEMDLPDYAGLAEKNNITKSQLEEEYLTLSKKLNKKHFEESLPYRIGMIQGVAILSILKRIQPAFYGGEKIEAGVHKMRKIAEFRNKSVLAHGTKTLTEEDSQSILEHAEKLATAILKDTDLSKLNLLRQSFEPLTLNELQQIK